MTPAGILCPGTPVGLANSEVGVSYQLIRNNSIKVGAVVAGTGKPINFGSQDIPGTYTIEATGANGCPHMMDGSVVINPLPTAFIVNPAGTHCQGTAITLNGSETVVEYILFRGGIFPVDTLQGTGSALNFGLPAIEGMYLSLIHI